MAKKKYPVGKHPNSLANLRPPGVASWEKDAEPGNTRGVKHLAYADPSYLSTQEIADTEAAIAAAVPVRAVDGAAPAADAAMIRLTAQVVVRQRHVSDWLAQNGMFHRGKLRPVVEKLGTIERQLADLLDALGMTPRSRAKLGLDLVRSVSLADAMSEPDPATRKAMLRDAGLNVDGTAEDDE